MRLLRNSFANFKSVKKISAVMFLIAFHRFFDNCSPIFAHKPPEGGGVAGSLPVYGTPLKIYTVLQSAKRNTFMPYLPGFEGNYWQKEHLSGNGISRSPIQANAECSYFHLYVSINVAQMLL